MESQKHLSYRIRGEFNINFFFKRDCRQMHTQIHTYIHRQPTRIHNGRILYGAYIDTLQKRAKYNICNVTTTNKPYFGVDTVRIVNENEQF